jgi:hypothetical protein
MPASLDGVGYKKKQGVSILFEVKNGTGKAT